MQKANRGAQRTNHIRKRSWKRHNIQNKITQEGELKTQKQKKNILIVDDDKSILQIFTRILQKQGYNTDTAETGEETVQKLKANHYDLALVDIKLPDTDGADLIAKMNTLQPNIVKIAITGFPSIENGTKVMDLGAAAYLVKPVKSEDLIRIIAEKLKD